MNIRDEVVQHLKKIGLKVEQSGGIIKVTAHDGTIWDFTVPMRRMPIAETNDEFWAAINTLHERSLFEDPREKPNSSSQEYGFVPASALRVRAKKRVVEGGGERRGDPNEEFPHPEFIHAEPGETGTIVGVERRCGGETLCTVRFDRTGSSTIVFGGEVEVV